MEIDFEVEVGVSHQGGTVVPWKLRKAGRAALLPSGDLPGLEDNSLDWDCERTAVLKFKQGSGKHC
jgi:hypothetical protein